MARMKQQHLWFHLNKADKNRLVFRCKVETVIKEYDELCSSADYDFEGDITDIIYDATGGRVDL